MSRDVPPIAERQERPSGNTTSGEGCARSGPPDPDRGQLSRPADLLPAQLDPQQPQERLVALGVAPPTARALVDQYGTRRVVDALDAVDTLGDGEVRRRAGWVISAIRQGWDLDGLLAERRQFEARYARWERERSERDRQAAGWRARESLAGSWRAAISGALDDRQLARAVEQVTTPAAGLGRRSVPVVRAQLLAWAIGVHRQAPDRPLAEAWADDIDRADRVATPASLDGPLAPPPGVTDLPDDLTERLTELLGRRADLSQPGASARERADGARGRALGEGVGHGR